MEDARRAVNDAIAHKTLPEDSSFLELLMSADKSRFVLQESDAWDYKAEWPFSYSDDYCGGIVRLILAFHNSYGGIIIFGVDDKSGASSKTKVRANIERLNALLRTHLNSPIVAVHHQYNVDAFGGPVDVLLVPRKDPGQLPVRQVTAIGRYPAGALWVRRSHEVLEASSQDLTILYGAYGTSDGNDGSAGQLLGYLPPKPATVKQFVGRMEQLDALFDWLLRSDEPRTFIYGKGGSGKTTIAYEFGAFVRNFGYRLTSSNEAPFDIVIFVSAKEKSLNPLDQTAYSVSSDFGDELELYQSLLLLSEYISTDEAFDLNIKEARIRIKEMMDNFSCLFIVDDIDTLTTKGIDIGFDYMFRVACKATSRNKILYTLRNAPTHALLNSIEVPGLRPGAEFSEFVEACGTQFNVERPKGDELLSRFEEVTERRPLIIETVMGIRRSSSSYAEALNLFLERGGDEARRYTFSREWEALPPDNQARNLLAAIALYGRPARLDDLVTILQMDNQTVMGAISSVSEMFLVREPGDESTRFSMGKLTMDFVLAESRSLTYFEKISARVKLYKQHEYRKPQIIANLEIRCSEAVRNGQSGRALHLLQHGDYPAAVTEHPAFKSLYGWVCCNQHPPMLPSAREAFEYCMNMNAKIETRYLHHWYWTEKNAGFGGEICDRICEFVVHARNYDIADKAAFALKAAVVLFERSRDLEIVNPTDAREILRAALVKHLRCYTMQLQVESGDFSKSYKYTQDTAFKYFGDSISSGHADDIFDLWRSLRDHPEVACCGPLVDPMIYALRLLERRMRPEERKRYTGKVRQLREPIESPKLRFDDDADRAKIITEVKEFLKRN